MGISGSRERPWEVQCSRFVPGLGILESALIKVTHALLYNLCVSSTNALERTGIEGMVNKAIHLTVILTSDSIA